LKVLVDTIPPCSDRFSQDPYKVNFYKKQRIGGIVVREWLRLFDPEQPALSGQKNGAAGGLPATPCLIQ
jgi:hypothetical protein